jgi:hypothetical protein
VVRSEDSGVSAPAPAEECYAKDVLGGFLEFLLVGGVTLFLFPLAWLLRAGLGLEASTYGIGFLTFYGAYVVNDPHFAVTYVLFYRGAKERVLDRALPWAQRGRYVLAGAVVPAVLVVWAVASLALRSAQSLGWMVQLMFLLVGWHYVKQGFGVLTVLSARRGVRITPLERKVILAHCFAGWAYAWASPAMAAGEFEEKGVVYAAPAHPRWLELTTGAVLALSTIALGWVLFARWRRRDRERPLPFAPTAAFLITIWSWTIYSSIDPFVQYVIPALHSIQYLYFVWRMKRTRARAEEGPPSFGRPVAVRLGGLAVSALALGWVLFHGAPGFLDGVLVAPSRHRVLDDPLGATPFFASFFVIVNIHHYFMDHAIWRREHAETRFLRLEPGAEEARPAVDGEAAVDGDGRPPVGISSAPAA